MSHREQKAGNTPPQTSSSAADPAMNSKARDWTPEPWEVTWIDKAPGITTASEEWEMIAENFETEADARRSVDCVNACAGIADPLVVPEMVAFIRVYREILAEINHPTETDSEVFRALQTVIARIDGGQP